jgi:PBP1b-binding outer membrane lipoprotein LpoB
MQILKSVIAVMAIVVLLVSCAREVTVQQAANNHYKHCRAVR